MAARIIAAGAVLMLARPVMTEAEAGAEPGELDPSFGDGGVALTSVTDGSDGTGAVVVQPDGRILAAGSADQDFALVRHLPDGSLDPSFGDGGKVVAPTSSPLELISAVALQPDGKIVAGGLAIEAHQDFALARYNPDGSLDASFGDGGTVVTDWAGLADSVGGVVVLPDGKIIASGSATPVSGAGPRVALVRYNPDGSLDPGFGDGGKLTLDLEDPASAGGGQIVVQPDGRMVVAVSTPFGLAAARVFPDGSVDRSFGQGGASVVPFDYPAGGGAVDLAPDGRIVLAGTLTESARGDRLIALARLTPNGQPDPTFSDDGRLATQITWWDEAAGVVVQPDGRIVVAATLEIGSGSGDFAVVRYTIDGNLDPTFADGGVARTDTPDVLEGAGAVTLQTDGKIVAAGSFAGDVAVARYHA